MCLHDLVNIVTHVKNFECHVQFADWCAPVKVSNCAVDSVLQALQFQEVTGISHN
jgi:hypothetical protein